MYFFFPLIYGTAYYFRPEHSIQEWAKQEALKREAADDED